MSAGGPDEAPSGEGAAGWAWLGCSTVVLVGLPMWFVATALVLHLGGAPGGAIALPHVVQAAVISGVWLGLLFALVQAMLLAWRGGGRVLAMRAEAQRRRLDAELSADARLPADSWGEAREHHQGEVVPLPRGEDRTE